MQTLEGSVHLCLMTGIPPNHSVGYNKRKPLSLSNTDKTLLDCLFVLELQNLIQENIGPVKDLKVL